MERECPFGLYAQKKSFALLSAWLAASVNVQMLLGSCFLSKYQFRNVGMSANLYFSAYCRYLRKTIREEVNGLDFFHF